MNDQEFNQLLEQALGQNLSAGTDTFRDDLLARCLEILSASEHVTELDDSQLELLAAAGIPFPPPPES